MSNEEIKRESRFLRGTIAQSLVDGGTHFDESDLQLLKFHGTYQQENRDERAARRSAGLEKAYQFMVRTRIPAGALQAEQYLAHDDLARRFGNGTVRFTTRQGIQLHGVLKGNLRPTIQAINESLLSTLAACGDVNRNVMACSAPLPGPVRSRVREFARELALRCAPRTRAYHEIWIEGERAGAQDVQEVEPLYGPAYLPRKFKIGIALEDDNCIDVYTQDIGLVAHAGSRGIDGFTVLAGGGLGSTHGKTETYPRLATPLCFIAFEDAIALCEAIITVQRDYGDRTNRKHARMKYLIEERGVEWFRQEVEIRIGRTLDAPRELQFTEASDHLGWHREANGNWFLGVHVRSGRVADLPERRLLTALRESALRFRPGMCITPQQNVLLTGIDSRDRAELESLLEAHGIRTDPGQLGIERRALACPAIPTCGLAVAEAERALPELLAELDASLRDLDLQDRAPSVRMTGCPNGCARPRMGDIGIVGRSLGIYDVFIGGDAAGTRLNTLFAKAVRLDRIVSELRPLLQRWKEERAHDEGFGDFYHRATSLELV